MHTSYPSSASNRRFGNLVLGIDASNIRAGGGVRHLEEFLGNADFKKWGFKKVILWTGTLTSFSIIDAVECSFEVRARDELSEGNIARYIHLIANVRAEAATECDVIFFPGGLPFPSKVPTVTMFRNMLPFDKRNKKALRPRRKRLKFELLKVAMAAGFKHANATIFLNEFAFSLVKSKYKIKSGFVVPHGISNIFDFPEREFKEFSKESEVKILYVSSFHEYKGHRVLIDAFEKLGRTYPNSRLRLVGGHESAQGMKIISEIENNVAISDRVDIVGPVKDSALVEEYRSADIFVYPSSCENMPNILLEAMRAKLPIACSSTEPMPSILRKGGIFFNSGSSKEICASIRALIDKKEERVRLSNLAYENSQQFSWWKCANETMRIISIVV